MNLLHFFAGACAMAAFLFGIFILAIGRMPKYDKQEPIEWLQDEWAQAHQRSFMRNEYLRRITVALENYLQKKGEDK